MDLGYSKTHFLSKIHFGPRESVRYVSRMSLSSLTCDEAGGVWPFAALQPPCDSSCDCRKKDRHSSARDESSTRRSHGAQTRPETPTPGPIFISPEQIHVEHHHMSYGTVDACDEWHLIKRLGLEASNGSSTGRCVTRGLRSFV
jgi:hypothetical protein